MKKRVSTRLIKQEGQCIGMEIVQCSGTRKISILLNKREMEYLGNQLDSAVMKNSPHWIRNRPFPDPAFDAKKFGIEERKRQEKLSQLIVG